LEVIKTLISAGADVNAKVNKGRAPLHRATENEHFGILKLLVSVGANVNAKDTSGWAPLHLAVLREHLEVIKS